MKAKTNGKTAVLVALVVLAASAIRMVTRSYEGETVLRFVRSSLHLGLFTVWGLSLSRRVVQREVRRNLCSIAGLVVFWLTIKTLKYYVVTDVNAARYIWYLYYLPLVYIPLLILFASFYMGKADSYRMPRRMNLLYIPALLLFLLVMTNDLHQLVFRFPADAVVFPTDDYTYGFGYYLVFGWFVACTVAAFALMLSHYKSNRKYKEFIPLLVSLFLTLFFIVTIGLRFPLTLYLAADFSVGCCLLFAAVLESCVYCGLIPTNTRYDELFAATVGNNAQIVDQDYRVRYASREAAGIPEQQMRQAEQRTVMLSEGKMLHNMPISGGHAIWTEDVSELIRLKEQLTAVREELIERSAILRYEYELEKERKTVEEQNRLYDLLTAATQKQIDRISALMKAYEAVGEDVEAGRRILSRIAVLGSYVKRKKHLTLSVYSSVDVAEEELKNALAESIRYLQPMGVRCTMFVETGRPYLPGETAALAYDFFEAAVEAAMDSLFAMMVTVSVVSGILRIRLTVGCREDLSVLTRDYPEACAERSDEDEWSLILPLKGGTGG